MNNRTISNFLFPDTKKWKYWLFIALLFKGILFVFQLSLNRTSFIHGFWGATGGDTNSYLSPIDNLLNSGSYSPDYRMPGYGFIYLILILFFSKVVTCNLIIILQLILSAISTYLLALTAGQLLNKKGAFYLVFYLYAISCFSNSFDIFLYTESFATSFMIFSVFYFVRYFNSHDKKQLLFSGIFLTWVIFLRPVFCLLPVLFLLILIIENKRKKIKVGFAMLLFIAPFLLCDGAWITRNYRQHRKILPLSTTVYYPELETSYYLPLKNFIGAWGGEYFWYSSSFILHERKDSIPKYIYTSRFNRDSVSMVNRLVYEITKDSTLPEATKEQYDSIVKVKCNQFTQSIKKEKPIIYFVKAPLVLLNGFLIHSGNSYMLFNKSVDKLNTFQFIINGFYYLFYLVVIIMGFVGMFLMYKYLIRGALLSLIIMIPLYDIFIHVIVFRECDSRYFIPVYSLMLICAVCAILRLFDRYFSGSE